MNRHVSVRQLELLVDYMEQHCDLATCRVRSKEGRDKSTRMWTELATILNAEGEYSSYSRTPKEWSRFYNDYKCRVRTKARKKNLLNTDCGPEEEAPQLTPLEKRLCAIVGPDKFPAQSKPSAIDAIYSDVPDFSVNEDTIDNELESLSQQKLQKEKQWRQKKSPSKVETTKKILFDIEKSRLEYEQAQLEVEKKRNEIELQKVHALNYLANAMWAMANKSSKNQVPESSRDSNSSED